MNLLKIKGVVGFHLTALQSHYLISLNHLLVSVNIDKHFNVERCTFEVHLHTHLVVLGSLKILNFISNLTNSGKLLLLTKNGRN